MLPSPDHCADQVVDGSRQRLKVSVVDPAGLHAPRQVLDSRHPIARRRGPADRLDFNLARVVLNDRDRLDSLDVAFEDLDSREPIGRGPAPFGGPRPAGRGTPLRHASADLDDDRPTAPATLQDLPRRPGGLASNRPIACLLDGRFHSFITSQRNDAAPRMQEVCLTLREHDSSVRRTDVTVIRRGASLASGAQDRVIGSERRSVIELTSQQAARQRARRRAIDPAMRARIAAAQRDQRISRLATKLALTLVRRDEAIQRWDRRAGDILIALTRGEHLTLDEAVAWSRITLTKREARRMRTLAERQTGEADQSPTSS